MPKKKPTRLVFNGDVAQAQRRNKAQQVNERATLVRYGEATIEAMQSQHVDFEDRADAASFCADKYS